MKVISTCVWHGYSERAYEYQILPLEAEFQRMGGNFILCDRDVLGDWSPLYIGQTDDLCECLGALELKRWIREQGATYIHVHLVRHDVDRESEKADLISRFRPPLNRFMLN
ncbi:hypothetical protein N8642_00155 [bacterium]|jgi:hypothetical protein|nr:hypothetical protein [Verrucomicrobiota bacterium]MDA7644755.1 hypothetical protein [bacterium]